MSHAAISGAALIAVGTFASSCAGTATRARATRLVEARSAGVSFTYSADDFTMADTHIEPRLTALDIGDGVDEGLAPEHVCFRLGDRRPLVALEQGPRYFFPARSFLCVIPLEDASVEDFGAAYPSLEHAASGLRAILRERPAAPQARTDVPDIPLNNAGRSILSRFESLSFRSGMGILFLTQYSQEIEPNPINNEELVLDFQGITHDGGHYVAARLAITHPSLPRGIDFTDHIERDAQYEYLSRGARELEAFSEEAFRPSLTSLKAMLRSIVIE